MVEFDSPWKDALDEYFPAFMEFFFPEAYREIDWSRGYESLDNELQQVVRDAELGPRRVDRLFKVSRTDGEEAWILIHIEIQSQEDADFPKRMFVYHYRIFDKFGRVVVSLAILGDTRPSWRPSHFEYNTWGCRVRFDFPAVKLLDYADKVAELEASSNAFATVVLAHLKSQETRGDTASRRAWKFRLVRGLYDRGYDARKIRRLFTFIDWMLDLPKPLEIQFWNDVKDLEQEKRMPYVTSGERIGIEKGLQLGIEQGRELGLEQGLEQGRELGHAVGIREGLLEGIELALELKFGAVGSALLPEIRNLTDVARLRVIHQAIKTVASVDELRRVVASN